jgi:hypothetical protein
MKIAAGCTPFQGFGSVRPYASPMRMLAILAAFVFATAPAGLAQQDSLSVRPFTEGLGGSVLLTNHGFGIGGLWRLGLASNTSLVLEASLGAGKDEREQEFFSGPFGETVTPFKLNNFLMLPVTLGLEQRLWADAIEDNFRPFIQGGAGPVAGFQWPYFEDHNSNGIREPDEPRRGPFDFRDGSFRFGTAAIIAVGAYFGEGDRNTIGVRIGYAMQYFLEPVELLERRPQIEQSSRQFFGTPVLTLHVLAF